jgi:DNA-binding MarR family transcriptional regulator
MELGRDRWAAEYGTEHAVSMETVSSITRTREVLVDFMESRLLKHDMNFVEYDVMSIIELIGCGSVPLGKIRYYARRHFSHQTSVTNIVNRLAKKGFIELVVDTADRRVTFAQLTAVGRRRVRAAHLALADADFGLDGLSEKEQRQLNHLLFKVRALHGDTGPVESRFR